MAVNVRVKYSVDDKALDSATKKILAQQKAIGLTEEEVSALNKSLNQTAKETGKIKKETSELEKGFNKVAKIAAGAFAIQKIKGFVANAISLASVMEQNRVAFEQFTGSAKNAERLLKQIEGFAASTPFQFPELVESSKKLLAFNVAQEDILPTLKSIGDITAGVGGSVSELAEIYGKAKVQGRLFAEDINQLTGRGIPIIGELAKQFGVAEKDVKGLVETGQVGFDNIEQAFRDMTTEGGKFFDLTAKQSQTTAGKLSTLGDNFQKIARGLGEDLLPVVNFFVDGLLDIVGANETVVDGLIKEKAEINALVPLIKDVSIGEQTRAAAIERINELAPELLKNLDTETVSTFELSEALNAYNDEIDKQIRLEASRAIAAENRDAINKATQTQIKAELELAKIADANLSGRIKENATTAEKIELLKTLISQDQFTNSNTGILIGLRQQAIDKLEVLNGRTAQYTKNLQEAEDAIKGVNDEGGKNVEVGDDIAGGAAKAGISISELKKELKELKKAYDDAGTDEERNRIDGQISALEKQIKANSRLTAAQKKKAKAMKAEAGSIAAIKKEISDLEKKKTFITDPETIGKTTAQINKLNKELLFLEGSFEEIGTGDFTKELSEGLVKASDELPGREIGEIFGTDMAQAAAEALQNEISEEDRQAFMESFFGTADSVAGLFGEIGGAIDAFRDLQTAKDLDALDKEKEARIAAAGDNAAEVEAIEQEFALKREQIEAEAAKKEQATAISQAIVNTALGVTKALATLPPPFNFIEAAAITAAGAAQIATIRSQQFKEGGYTGDIGPNQVAGQVHGQEYVITATQTRKNRPFLDAWHQDGGGIEEFIPKYFGMSSLNTSISDTRGLKHLRNMDRNQRLMIRKMDEQTDLQKSYYARANGSVIRRRGFA